MRQRGWTARLGAGRTGIRRKLIIAGASRAVIIIWVFPYLIIDTREREMLDELIPGTREGAKQPRETVERSTRRGMLTVSARGGHRVVEAPGRREGVGEALSCHQEGQAVFSSDSRDRGAMVGVGQVLGMAASDFRDRGAMVDKQAEGCYICHAGVVPVVELAPAPRREGPCGANRAPGSCVFNPRSSIRGKALPCFHGRVAYAPYGGGSVPRAGREGDRPRLGKAKGGLGRQT